jgi:DNA polymerase-3 subunit alpha
MTRTPVVHLHVHSTHSLLDGASFPADLARAAARDGQPALAVTDHGNLYGAVAHYDACLAEGVKPIIGIEAYFVPDTSAKPEQRYHMTLLATGAEGYRSLCRLSSAAFLEGFHRKPLVDWALLERHAEGLIGTTGCLGGLVPQLLLAGDEAGAKEALGRFVDILGKDQFLAEIQRHGIPDEDAAFSQLAVLAAANGVPLVATNDSHYTKQADAKLHDALLCVQTRATISQAKRFRFQGSGYWLKSSAEMRALFADLPEALDRTLLVAEACETTIPFRPPACPHFLPVDGPDGPIPEERVAEEENRLLAEHARSGAERRYGAPLPAHVAERLEHELSTITAMGFAGYFLVVEDLVAHARAEGIGVGPGRGSAAGSLVAYSLGITDIDPVANGLVFERFLNPERVGMPDIDLDFDDARRDEMIRYAAKRYGFDRVARIGTLGVVRARTAIRDAARVLGKPYALGDRLSSLVPPSSMGRDVPLRSCFVRLPGQEDHYRAGAALRSAAKRDPDADQVLGLALEMEGAVRAAGVHAAGVVIANSPLADTIPLQRAPGGSGDDVADVPVTQFDLHEVERLGLVKFDFLGLRTLGVIQNAVRLAREAGEDCPDPEDIPLDDPATYRLLSAGRTVGVFQFESPGIRQVLVETGVERFEHIAALTALYRPGPMAAGMHRDYAARKRRGAGELAHESLRDLLAETYGLMVYQEQMMLVARHFAGYGMGDADVLRKACAKKDRCLIAKERERFVQGCMANGHPAALGEALFDLIQPFADYAFNKSHAVAYALVSYRSAWLKAHHPAAFWGAQVSSVAEHPEKAARYLAAARDEGTRVLGPDVNRSQVDVVLERCPNGTLALRLGLAAVKGVGRSQAAALVAARGDQAYRSLADLAGRLGRQAKSATIERLVKAGALDCLGQRRALLDQVAEACRSTREKAREDERGLVRLFDAEPHDAGRSAKATARADGDPDPMEQWSWEQELLGIGLSAHPLAPHKQRLEAKGLLDPGTLFLDGLARAGRRVGAYGVLTSVSLSRRGRCTGVLVGPTGTVPIVAYGPAANATANLAGQPVAIHGALVADTTDQNSRSRPASHDENGAGEEDPEASEADARADEPIRVLLKASRAVAIDLAALGSTSSGTPKRAGSRPSPQRRTGAGRQQPAPPAARAPAWAQCTGAAAGEGPAGRTDQGPEASHGQPGSRPPVTPGPFRYLWVNVERADEQTVAAVRETALLCPGDTWVFLGGPHGTTMWLGLEAAVEPRAFLARIPHVPGVLSVEPDNGPALMIGGHRAEPGRASEPAPGCSAGAASDTTKQEPPTGLGENGPGPAMAQGPRRHG